jgi:GxxExxY protein
MTGSEPPFSDPLTREIIAAVIHVHDELGPGFLESVYQRAMAVELARRHLGFSTEVDVPIHYAGELIGRHRLDLVVGNRVIVELKTVEALSRAHYAQLSSYLKASAFPIGLLVNFAGARAEYRRLDRDHVGKRILSSHHPVISLEDTEAAYTWREER